MTKKRSTKRALLLSALSLLLCVSLLVSSTFAWFTDSVTSKNNIIKSGNLDLTLEYWDGQKWTDVQGSSDILDKDALYEPGYVQVAYLKLDNVGSLALKYQLGINIINEINGVNQDGQTFKLSDYIYFGVIEGVNGETNAYTNRADAIKDINEAKLISKGYTKATSMKAEDPALYLALVIYMPETVGNVANHNGKDVPSIELGINAYATQYTYEKDSFNEFYDKDAWHPDFEVYNANDLQAALNNAEPGDIIALENNIEVTEPFTVPADANVVIDLNGNAFTGKIANANDAVLVNNGTLSIVGGTVENKATNGGATISNKGNLTLADVNVVGAPIADGGYPAYAINNTANLIVEEGTSISSDRGCLNIDGTGATVINGGAFTNNDISSKYSSGLTSHVVYVRKTANNELTINDGTFKHLYTKTSGGVVINNSSAVAAKVNGGNFSGGNYFGKWDNLSDYGSNKVKPPFVVTGGTFTGLDTTYLADGYKAIANTDGTYTVLKGDVVATDDNGLKDAIANGKNNIALGAGEFTMPGTSGDVSISGTTDTVINITAPRGNKVALNGVTVVAGAYKGIQHSDTVVFENCVLKGDHFLYANNVIIKNCVVELAADQYIWTYSAKNVEFIDCIFNTAGKAILMYNEGPDLVTNVSVKGCTFNATQSALASGNVAAAIEIGSSIAVNGHYTLTTENNVVDSKFSGEWRIKNSATNNTTVNGVIYNRVEDGLYKDEKDNLFIYNANGLKAFNAYMTTNAYAHKIWGATFTLLNDIDASGITWNNMQLNTPNVDCDGFTVDGNGFTISNLTINGAMFHSTANGKNSDIATVFKDLTFDNVTVNGNYHTGIIWSQMYGDVELNNVHVINSNITGKCNVGALIGRNGDEGASTVKFTNCSVKNTTVTSTGGGDNCGASAFLGMALRVPNANAIKEATLEMSFENCVAEGNTLVSAAGHQGGGIYATADVSNETWNTPVVVKDFTNFSNK